MDSVEVFWLGYISTPVSFQRVCSCLLFVYVNAVLRIGSGAGTRADSCGLKK